MNERTASHKSEGRASSVHSIRSAASGRASLNLDTAYGLGDSGRSPMEHPGLAPGLALLGSVPAIIRCWMNTNFKHDALLYAAVCTGSFKSFLDMRLIRKLGFEEQVNAGDDESTIKLPVYFPEAVHHPASSRSSSPAPQLPSRSCTIVCTATTTSLMTFAIVCNGKMDIPLRSRSHPVMSSALPRSGHIITSPEHETVIVLNE